jgi:hypothetical protein
MVFFSRLFQARFPTVGDPPNHFSEIAPGMPGISGPGIPDAIGICMGLGIYCCSMAILGYIITI